jgi:hypothetical protein
MRKYVEALEAVNQELPEGVEASYELAMEYISNKLDEIIAKSYIKRI